MSPILVTAATGRHGSTGAFVARTLLELGHPVRVLVRRCDGREQRLERLGAEIVTGDLQERASLVSALEGVEVAYFCYPVAGGIVQAAANVAQAGREAGLRRVVVMSMGAAHPQSPSPLGRSQWLAEQVLEWSGITCCHLRVVAFFYENLLLLHGHSLRSEGVIRNSFGQIAVNWIAAEDAARMAVALLLAPGTQTETALYPSGGERLTHAQVAGVLSEVLGRAIRYEAVEPTVWQRELVALSAREPAINQDMAAHITALSQGGLRLPPLNDVFGRLTGRKAMDLRAFVEKNRDRFQEVSTGGKAMTA